MISVNSTNFKTFLITILDIGPRRLISRILYEIKKIFFLKIPNKFIVYIYKIFFKIPNWKENLNYENIKNIKNIKLSEIKKEEICFEFLNEKKSLIMPLDWNDPSWSRLWKFNLHYFDWAKYLIEEYIIDKEKIKNLNLVSNLIDQWIKNNHIGKGDGWHSYTLSLRIKNWVLIFRLSPNFITKKRLDSLWVQICWLNNNKESFLGGNHFIENLTALIIGSMQFDSIEAKNIYKKSLTILRKELDTQILKDGGHEERSASYHLLILDRLVELGFHIQIIHQYKPDWLEKKIKVMTEWLRKIRLFNDLYPRFNDCSFDKNYNLNTVLNFSYSYLGYKYKKIIGFRKLLSESITKKKNLNIKYKDLNIFNKSVKSVDLPDTGWTILKPGKDWELLFKCGSVCPKHLPVHCHSDLLSFDLFNKGIPIFSEYGTSIYGNNRIRSIERSTEAHNSFQLSFPIKKLLKKRIKWIEPIEVWDNFRAGRKAQILKRESSGNSNSESWVVGSHDAYKRFGASHKRYLEVKIVENDKLILIVEDFVKNKQMMAWRQFWHLGPKIDQKYLKLILQQLEDKFELKYLVKETWHSLDFGKRLPRKTLMVEGILLPGEHLFKVEIKLPQMNT